MKKILLLEDEPAISEFIEITLKKAGYTVYTADTGMKAIDTVEKNQDIDIAILDVMLPDISGFEVCKKIRSLGRNMGIIILTARSQEADRITGLMLGADDYVVKPFSPSELVLRADALYRRIGNGDAKDKDTVVNGDFELNDRARTVLKKGILIELTQVEYQLMKYFMMNPGKAMSRENILINVWGEDYAGELKIVDVNIRRLRIKIEESPANPNYIQTVWGYGYKWNDK